MADLAGTQVDPARLDSRRVPNIEFRRARLRLASRFLPGRRMSRQELAEAVNAQVFAATGRRVEIDGSYIGKLERGSIRWPRAHLRRGLAAVLGAKADGEIGLYSDRLNGGDEAFLAADPVLNSERRTGASSSIQDSL